MKIGWIGMGNMAQALAAGFLASGKVKREDLLAYAPNQEKLKANADRIGFWPVSSAKELVLVSDWVVMACKPYQIQDVLEKVGPELKNKVLISVCAGWDYETYQPFLDPSVRFQFVMPNTPAMVGEGVFLMEEKNSLREEERAFLMGLLESLGLVQVLPSRLMGIGGAISGCGPAFVDLWMEAYADAAVKYGIPRDISYRLVSQTVLGAAKLQQKTGAHPGVLKDQVTSPGGTTIRGCAALEAYGLRAACLKSIDAIMER